MYVYNFERLEVWQLARELSKKIYQITRSFPNDEKFGIVSQLRRASVSICSNLAEGSSRKSNKDKSHFYSLAFGSLLESVNQIILSRDFNWITDQEYVQLRQDFEKLSNKINSLRNTVLA